MILPSDYDPDTIFLFFPFHLPGPFHSPQTIDIYPFLPLSSTSFLEAVQSFVPFSHPCPLGLSPVLYLTHS
jgi:hypothetical protein